MMNQDKKQYFHFTLGPVQGFVAQARRTRDFWAGSFLLSWLSAVAIKAVKKQQGELIFPMVDESYLAWLEGREEGDEPQQGCIPNRFKGGVAEVPSDFNPETVQESIRVAWNALAEQVWQQDMSTANPHTRTIWERQINSFWEISWVMTADNVQSNLLDRRKNWRTHLPPAEPGVKCMMMDGYQELSGVSTPNSKALRNFWDEIRTTGGKRIKTDLREGEYLCAMALIKRRFAHCFPQLSAPMPGGWTLKGWKVPTGVPSVAYIAAAPALAQIIHQAPQAELDAFHQQAHQLTEGYGESSSRIRCVTDAIHNRGADALSWRTAALDGNVFFESTLDNRNIYPDQRQAASVKQALQALRRSVKDGADTTISPFYAVLMMDGDSLGSLMNDLNKQQRISQALNEFTGSVKAIVEEENGFLIYAGGGRCAGTATVGRCHVMRQSTAPALSALF